MKTVTGTQQFLHFNQYHMPIGPDGTPFDELKRLRDEAFEAGSWVGWCESHGGFWLIAGWREARAVLRDAETFTNEVPVIPPFVQPTGQPMLLAGYDGEQHSKYRRLVQEQFSPKNAGQWAEAFRRDTWALIDQFIERGSADLAEELIWMIPRRLVARLTGLPVAETGDLAAWIYSLTHSVGFGFAGVEDAVGRMRERFQPLLEHRRSDPGDDILSYLITEGQVDGVPLSDDELFAFFTMLIRAPLENTALFMSDAVWLLAQDPELRRRLIDEPDLFEPSIDEMLRYFSPASGGSRLVAREVEIGGVVMRPGDVVLPYLPLVNRDPRQFDNPDTFIPDRTPNRYLALGNGVHRCLGAHLLRVEAVNTLAELLRRIPDFALDPERPSRWALGGGGGMKSVPVVFEPGGRADPLATSPGGRG